MLDTCISDRTGGSGKDITENRRIKINYAGTGNNSQFTYDAFGKLVSIIETVGGIVSSTKQFVWAGGLSETRNSSGTILAQYFVDGQTVSGSSYFYFKDHLGSVREMTDSSGTIVDQKTYDPYGKVNHLQGSTPADLGYAGYYYHAASGLNFSVARAYNASLGRWINRDPIGEKGGLNLFEYARNVPLALVDPSGLAPGDFTPGTPVQYSFGGGTIVKGVVGPGGEIQIPGWLNCAGYACGLPYSVQPAPGKSAADMMAGLGYKCKKVDKECDCKCPPGSGPRVMVFSSTFNQTNGFREVHAFRDYGGGVWTYYPYNAKQDQPDTPKEGYSGDPFDFPFDHPDDYKNGYCCCK